MEEETERREYKEKRWIYQHLKQNENEKQLTVDEGKGSLEAETA